MFGEFRKRLDRLRSLDPKHKVFGSSAHRYLSTVVDVREVERFEDRLGFGLPRDYRTFLIEVGSGAGPYYGLWSLQQSCEDLRECIEESSGSTDQEISPSDPFPLTRSDLDTIFRLRATGAKAPWATPPWPAPGCLPICGQGCTYYSVLVLRGEYAGRVWDLSLDEPEGSWIPARRPPGWWEYKMSRPTPLPPLPSPPTFGAWYGAWIKGCLLDLEDRDRYERAG